MSSGRLRGKPQVASTGPDSGGGPVEASLGAWYANPLAEEPAARLADPKVSAPGPVPGDGFLPRALNGMIGRYWLGRPVAADYEVLLAGARDDRARALVELVYGQLLAARKRPGALAHLEAGFRLARPWLSAQEYLAVMRRHQQLGRLYPAAGTASPRTLEALLIEALTIARLEGPAPRRSRPGNPADTTG
jgi:hypothetical protein